MQGIFPSGSRGSDGENALLDRDGAHSEHTGIGTILGKAGIHEPGADGRSTDGSATTDVSMQAKDYDKMLKRVYRTAPIGLCLLDTELRYVHINEWHAPTITNRGIRLAAGKHKLVLASTSLTEGSGLLESILPASEHTHGTAMDVHVSGASLNRVRR